MAMRHLKRIQEQASKAGLAKPEPEPEEETDEEEEEEEIGSTAPFNPFDLLSDDDDPPQEPEDDEEEDGVAEGRQEQAAAAAKPAAGSSKKAKKKKKAKSGKQQASAEQDGSDDEATGTAGGKGAAGVKGSKAAGGGGAKGQAAQQGSVEDDIDAIVRELNLTTVGAAAAAMDASSSAASRGGAGTASVLCVDVKGLRGDDELRRIFGSDVVAAVDRQDRVAAAEGRRVGAASRGMGGAAGRRRGLALKRGSLVAPKEHWPPCEGGLSMEMTGHKAGVPVFRYVHSPTYRDTQARFYRCQASYDPATIAALLQQSPYHVDSLLAMHDLYRHMGENSYAEEMLDRALWALEAAWHPSFQPASAACRLDYSVEENRPLFGALFRHVQALSRRGCHRAALEGCKLLLALEPEDPLGGLCLVDYLAVRAGRNDWLQRFVLTFEGNRSLALLPNYAFALPMAAARREAEAPGGEGGSKASGGSAAERAQLGASSSGSGSSPHDQLVGALLLHPLVLPRLVAKLQDKGAAKESWWKELLGRKLYAGASDGGSASLSHLVGLYVERSGELWKPPDLLGLLRKAAEEAADVAEGKLVPANGIGAADWRALARESFPPSTSNEYRHLRMADFSDAVNALPREEVEAAVQGGGAMQDVEEQLAELQEQMIMAQQQEQQQRGAGAGGGGAPAMTDEELRGTNPLLLLLRSLLPWVNAGQQPDYAAPAAAGGAAAAAALPEYDDEDGHLEDDDGVVRQVRR